jgi:hypothetical protein
VFAELRAGSTRKYAQCPVAYDLDNPWPIVFQYFSGAKYICTRLNLEACAELAAGQTDKALADVKLMLSLADSFKSQPFLISYLVRVACLQITIQPVWEGLAEDRWTDSQLQELQARFLTYDFFADVGQSLKGERAEGVLLCDQIKKKGMLLVPDEWPSQSPVRHDFKTELFKWIGRIMPGGWYDQEKLNYCEEFEDQCAGIVNFETNRVSPHNSPNKASKYLMDVVVRPSKPSCTIGP